MNLYEYVKNNNKTFEELPFNEVDNLVFAVLSYLDFEDMVSSNKKNKITLEELSKTYFIKYPKPVFKEDITVKRYTFKLLKELITSNRFKDVLVYKYVFNHNKDMQFGAVTFEFNNMIYISYEGTDDYISGWKEDCQLSYQFPVKAHKEAIKYLNSYTFTNKKIILGGHSKGGNLALVAGMLANRILRNKIDHIYSNDGPGLRLKELTSKKYTRIKDKYTHIIPNSSLVGILLRHDNDKVIKANGIIVYTHLPYTWQIDNNKFITSNLSKTSAIIDRGMLNWLDKYSYEQRELFVNELFKAFDDNNIYSLNQFKFDLNIIIDFLKSITSLDGIVKEMSLDLINVIKESIK